jgi:hypothetical protein
MARTVYQVMPAQEGHWQVRHGTTILSTHPTKKAAIEAGQEVAQADPPSQLVVRRGDASIEAEYPYGEDPDETAPEESAAP